MFLIMSAAYVDHELQSEFGRIPPSFLPLGNRRLFQHQVKLAPKSTSVCLSIPESFDVSKIDMQWLQENKVKLIRIPDGVSLGASLVASLNLSEHCLETPLHVLFGDTLFQHLPSGDNLIGVSEVDNNYNWATISNNDDAWLRNNGIIKETTTKNIVNGYFKFSDPKQIMRCITKSKWDFSEGLNDYHQSVGLNTSYFSDWLDFGHVNTYYKSKAYFTTQRSFNELTITTDWIEKSSVKKSKIEAEANWFNTLPYSLRGFIPQYLGSKNTGTKVSYKLEYLHQTALNELYVFSELPVYIWEKILKNCIEFLKQCRLEVVKGNVPINSLTELFEKKTLIRLKEYCDKNAFNLNEEWTFNSNLRISLQQLLDESNERLLAGNKHNWKASVLHGDFCFSNILYDFRSDRIKTIDPRGLTLNGELNIYGDVRYDIAKLSHSILGMYDWIIAGYHSVSIEGRNITFNLEASVQNQVIQHKFIELIEKEFGVKATTLMAMQIQLFLSMLPLHSDDKNRQHALFANAFRIYELMKRLDK